MPCGQRSLGLFWEGNLNGLCFRSFVRFFFSSFLVLFVCLLVCLCVCACPLGSYTRLHPYQGVGWIYPFVNTSFSSSRGTMWLHILHMWQGRRSKLCSFGMLWGCLWFHVHCFWLLESLEILWVGTKFNNCLPRLDSLLLLSIALRWHTATVRLTRVLQVLEPVESVL